MWLNLAKASSSHTSSYTMIQDIKTHWKPVALTRKTGLDGDTAFPYSDTLLIIWTDAIKPLTQNQAVIQSVLEAVMNSIDYDRGSSNNINTALSIQIGFTEDDFARFSYSLISSLHVVS